MTIKEIIGEIIDLSATIEIHKDYRKYSQLEWRGQARSIPEEFKTKEFIPIRECFFSSPAKTAIVIKIKE